MNNCRSLNNLTPQGQSHSKVNQGSRVTNLALQEERSTKKFKRTRHICVNYGYRAANNKGFFNTLKI